MKIKINSFWPAILWLTLSTIAFCIPGSALPKEDWLGKIHADKLVHIGIFSVMVFLWCAPLFSRSLQKPLPEIFAWIAVAFFGYGVMMEFVQHFLVLNRSFDWCDIAADTIGCLVGFFLIRRQWLTRST